jgi:large subunit ribosomal protein L9
MKVLLLKDVYKLGHAGDVKRVADGFGRNFLLPQMLAVLATPGALKRAEHIRSKANEVRTVLNNEMSGIAERISGKVLVFASKAGETGKLYGSVTSQMVVDVMKSRFGIEIDRHHLVMDPIRVLGDHKVVVRLTVDLNPEIRVIVYREGEAAPKGSEPELDTPVQPEEEQAS